MSYIRYLRKKNHMTQSKLAEILGVTQTSVSQWESGRNFPDIKTAKRLADYFDTTLDMIMTHSSDRKSPASAKSSIYGDKAAGGIALPDVVELELKRKMLQLFEQLSLTAKMRIVERAEAYLEVEALSAKETEVKSYEELEAESLKAAAESEEGTASAETSDEALADEPAEETVDEGETEGSV